MNTDVLTFASYAVAGTMLLDAYFSGGQSPTGVDTEFWKRNIRSWRKHHPMSRRAKIVIASIALTIMLVNILIRVFT